MDVKAFVIPFTWDCLSKPREMDNKVTGPLGTKVLDLDGEKTVSVRPIRKNDTISVEGQAQFDMLMIVVDPIGWGKYSV